MAKALPEAALKNRHTFSPALGQAVTATLSRDDDLSGLD